MKIYDCITFFDESLQTDLRFNILNNYVEKFIICESKFDHKGNYKGVNFNIDNYKEFKNKITHLVIDKQFRILLIRGRHRLFKENLFLMV